MKSTIACIIFLTNSLFMHAQWSTNSFDNNLVADVNSSDIQTACDDSNLWIAFYSKNGNNYDMRLQNMSPLNADKRFGEDGILVSNAPSGSATFVFNICIDKKQNCIVAFNYMKGNTMHAAIQKVSPSGTLLWGQGIDLGAGLSPYPVALKNNEIVVGWTNDKVINFQKISETGVVAWQDPKEIKGNPVSKAVSRPQLLSDSKGGFCIVYQQVSSFLFYTNLYQQKFDINGNGLWTNPLKVSTITTASYRYYDVKQQDDTTFIGYYGNPAGSNRFDAYVQRVSPDGSLPWGADGVAFSDYSGQEDPYEQSINITTEYGFDVNNIYAVCTFTNPGQTQSGIYIQKFNSTSGERLFGNLSKEIIPISNALSTTIGNNIYTCYNAVNFAFTDHTNQLYACSISPSGDFTWDYKFLTLSSSTNSKLRYGFVYYNTLIFEESPGNIAVWQENRNGDDRAYAQLYACDGRLGVVPVLMKNFTASLAKKNVILKWTTSTETNNKGFYIERSSNGKDYMSIGFVSTKAVGGNSSLPLQYAFDDINPFTSNYYRLKQIDKDGTVNYSQTLTIEMLLKNEIKISPNPVDKLLFIQANFSISQNLSLIITDAAGKIVVKNDHQSINELDATTCDVSALMAGVYQLVIISPNSEKYAATFYKK